MSEVGHYDLLCLKADLEHRINDAFSEINNLRYDLERAIQDLKFELERIERTRRQTND